MLMIAALHRERKFITERASELWRPGPRCQHNFTRMTETAVKIRAPKIALAGQASDFCGEHLAAQRCECSAIGLDQRAGIAHRSCLSEEQASRKARLKRRLKLTQLRSIENLSGDFILCEHFPLHRAGGKSRLAAVELEPAAPLDESARAGQRR